MVRPFDRLPIVDDVQSGPCDFAQGDGDEGCQEDGDEWDSCPVGEQGLSPSGTAGGQLPGGTAGGKAPTV